MSKYLNGDGLSHLMTKIKTWAAATFAPLSHASTDTTYGKADSSNYGHVKIADSVSQNPLPASSGIVLSQQGLVTYLSNGYAQKSHSHGSVGPSGTITSDTEVGEGDKLVIIDSSDSSKLKRSGVAFGSSTSTFLRNDGTWAEPSGGGAVTGVKGDSESSYRTGQVNITASNVGAAPSDRGGFKREEPAAVNVPSGTSSYTQIASKSLEAGNWLIVYGASFASNATGHRRVVLAGSTSPSPTRYSLSQMAVNGDVTRMSTCTLVRPASTTTYRVYAMQNSGTSLSTAGFIQAFRVGNEIS